MNPNDIRSKWHEHKGVESSSNTSECGCHLLKLRCKTVLGKRFYDGQIKEVLGEAKDVKVFVDRENIDARLWCDCANVLRFGLAPNVVDTRGFGVDLLGQNNPKSLYVAHDMFDDEYSSWILANGAKRTDAPWWITQAQNMLKTMKIFKDEQVYHGSLHKKESYAIRAKAIQILNFGNYFIGKGWVEMAIAGKKTDEAEKADKKALKEFFRSEVQIVDWKLWKHFLKCFDDFSYDQLRKHPVLLGDLERYNYLLNFTYKYRNMGETARTQFKRGLRKEDQEKSVGWVKEFNKGDVFYETLTYNGAQVPQIQDVVTLFEFIGKLLDHIEKNAKKVHLQITSQEMVASMILAKYPSILATLHYVAVVEKISPLLEIAGYYSR